MNESAVFKAFSHTGYVRSNNEDEYLYLRSNAKHYDLLIIADGMGGHSCGEIASKIAVQQSRRIIDEKFQKSMTDNQILDLMDYAIETANIHVEMESCTSQNKKGMGTTLTCGLITRNNLYISHVGDSRVYLLRNNSFKRLTKDDTYVQYLLDRGKITKQEAKTHPEKGSLIKALGVPEQLEPQLIKYPVQTGDRIVFCTDGLYDAITEADIRKILVQASNPNSAVNELIGQTLAHGAPDNVSVIVGFL